MGSKSNKIIFKRSSKRSSKYFPLLIITVIAFFFWRGHLEYDRLIISPQLLSGESKTISDSSSTNSMNGEATNSNRQQQDEIKDDEKSSRKSSSKLENKPSDASSLSLKVPSTLENIGTCPPLSEKLLDSIAKQNTLMLATASIQQTNFLRNWLLNMKDKNIDYFIVAAIDKNVSQLLTAWNIPCYEDIITIDQPQDEFEWGRKGWKHGTWAKVEVLDKLVDWQKYRIIVSDLDVAWFKNPLNILPATSAADIIYSHDGITSGTDPDPSGFTLENDGSAWNNVNTGLYVLYPTNRSAAAVHVWKGLHHQEVQMDDQSSWYTLARQGNVEKQHPEDRRVKTVMNETMWMGLVPSYVFSNGHSYGFAQVYKVKNATQPLAMHATWTYGGVQGKISRMREAMAWYDEPEYYSEGKYLTVNLPPIRMPDDYNTWQDNEPQIQFHITNLQKQIHQIYIGMAVAVALNRTFIFPEMQCYCDRIWYPVYRCRMIDTNWMEYPAPCPVDYYFFPDYFLDNEETFGRPVVYRERNFLKNPRTSNSIKESNIIVKPDKRFPPAACLEALKANKPQDTSCVTESTIVQTFNLPSVETPITTAVHISPMLTDNELPGVMKAYEDVRVWHLDLSEIEDIMDAFGGFECKSVGEKFEKRMERVLQEWCCRWKEDAEKLNTTEKIKLFMKPQGKTWTRNFSVKQSCRR